MKIIFDKKFVRAFSKLSNENKNKVNKALVEFKRDPFSQKLKNHALKGELKGKRSISAGYDLRILYREENEHIVIYIITVGTHDEVY